MDHETPTLVNLPLDLKTLLFSYIRKRADLKSLYTTCKDFYEIIIPRIYRRMRLKDWISISTLSAALSIDNGGLKHVRHIEVVPETRRVHGQQGCETILQMLANQLPRNVLVSLTVENTKNIKGSIIRTLHQRQSRLGTLRCGSDLQNVIWNKAGGISTESLTVLQFLVDSHHGLKHARKCIFATPHLEQLEIHVDLGTYCVARKLEHDDELHRATASENIVDALLGDDDEGIHGSSPDEEGTKPRQLSALRLHGLNLSGVAVRLLKIVEMPRLTALNLQYCESESVLLRVLATGDKSQCERLRHLAIVKSPMTLASSDRDSALNDFLCSFSNLESLVISAPATLALQAELDAVANHDETLRSLYLDCKLGYNDVDLSELDACEKLEQFAFKTLDLLLDEAHFEVDDLLQPLPDFVSEMDSLKTMHILNFPSTSGQPIVPRENTGGLVYVNECLKDIARHVFSLLPSVSTFAIGPVTSRQDRLIIGSIDMERKVYVRAKLTDMDGQGWVEAMEASVAKAMEIEPVSDLLELDPERCFVRYGQKE